MYELADKAAVEAIVEVRIGKTIHLLTNIVLFVDGDQKPETSSSAVKVIWRVGSNIIHLEVPLHRINNYYHFWVVPNTVA